MEEILPDYINPPQDPEAPNEEDPPGGPPEIPPPNLNVDAREFASRDYIRRIRYLAYCASSQDELSQNYLMPMNPHNIRKMFDFLKTLF